MPRLKVAALCPFTLAQSFLILAAIFTASSLASGQAETIVHDFIALPHGGTPEATLIADLAGNLYGTTVDGGTYGQGTVFKLALGTNGKWTQTVLYSFQGGNDSGLPSAGLIFDAAGNLYGTTANGSVEYGCNEGTPCGTVFKLSPNSNGIWSETILYTFSGTNDGMTPVAPVAFDNAGNLYGTTYYGGAQRYGNVFELTPTAEGPWTETVLYTFNATTDGGYPSAGVTLDAAGNVYGTTQLGGDVNCFNVGYAPYGCGVVFKLTHNSDSSWTESVLHSFSGYDGLFPQGNVIFDASGNLYGTTLSGPGLNCANGCGTVFKMSPGSGGNWTLATVYTFAGGLDGQSPHGGLVQGPDGNYYGTTQSGGGTSDCQYSCGTVFQLTPSSGLVWKEKVIHSFSGSANAPYGVDGNAPMANVVFDQAGNLYGTASGGGTVASCNGNAYLCRGTVFKMNQNSSGQWVTSLLYSFSASGDGLDPIGGLISDASGNLYGATQDGGAYGLGAAYELIAQSGGGYKERVIYSFAGGSDGFNPSGRLVLDEAGSLYGATYYGGVNSQCSYIEGCGTVFELSPGAGGKWTEKQLYLFGGTGGGDVGANSSLVFDSSGNLYGTISGGNSSDGEVYELSPSSIGLWTISILHSFSGTDGYSPGPVVFDASGNLFGAAGGGFKSGGIVYELSPGASGWTETIVHNFAGGVDGVYPSGVTFAKNGALIGTAYEGGNTNCQYGCGLVFEVVKSGSSWQKKNIYSFAGGTDGAYPYAVPAIDASGNIYGSTWAGGGPCDAPLAGCGTIYKLTSSSGTWSESILYVFGLVPHDVSQTGQLLLNPSNVLYGEGFGGDDGNGAVFQLDLNQAGSNLAAREQLEASHPGPWPQSRPPALIRPSPQGRLINSAISGKGGH